jgi:CubicO group peptidase (beta-lactamase class C family)
MFKRAQLDTATDGEIDSWSAGLRPGVSASGICEDAVPEAGAPVAVSRCGLFKLSRILLFVLFPLALTAARFATAEASEYFPPPESQGGWRKLEKPEDVRRLAGVDPDKLAGLKQWLLDSDKRGFAAVVIRRGHIVLEVERGNSAKTDSRRVASVSKAICATVLAIASEQSQQGRTPKKMKFDDRAFQFIPWAQPLSDPRKERITVKQLLNHTSGICPEATGAPNDGTWEYILGHSGDERTAKLAFDPGGGCGYSTHALAHAALVCETVTGKPYDQFAVEALFKPIGVEHWWFQVMGGLRLNSRVGRIRSTGDFLFNSTWPGKDAQAFWFPPSGWRLHADRALGRDRRHRDSGWSAPSRVVAREGEGQADELLEQPPTNGSFAFLVRR